MILDFCGREYPKSNRNNPKEVHERQNPTIEIIK